MGSELAGDRFCRRRLLSLLLDKGYHIYRTADPQRRVHRRRQAQPGVIARRAANVRPIAANRCWPIPLRPYPTTVALDIAGLPANFMPYSQADEPPLCRTASRWWSTAGCRSKS